MTPPHPMKHYEDLKRAWRRAHQAAGGVVKAFDEGDLKAVEINTQLVSEALNDAADAARRFKEAAIQSDDKR